MTQREVFHMNLDSMNAYFEKCGAVLTFEDGSQGIDTTKVNGQMASTYMNLLSYGYANGLV